MGHHWWPTSTPQIRLIEAPALCFLMTDILWYRRLIASYSRDKIAPRPKAMPDKIAAALTVDTRKVYRALAFNGRSSIPCGTRLSLLALHHDH